MSWQSYVDSNLVGTGACTSAAIIGHDGNTWATSAGFAVSPAEGKTIVAGFSNSGGLAASGIVAGGTKYMFLRAVDDRSIMGRKGTAGIHCVKTGKAVLVAIYDQPITPGQCSVVVEKLADYLIGVGF
mmetsp:Transcript_124479/g.175639  ORF Transcript_124479/g.175639 Transcript_124479/m.175639 type:complete len:128 (-) Transcript_124479:53-436(-)